MWHPAWHPASASYACLVLSFPLTMAGHDQRRTPKGTDSERSLLLWAHEMALWRYDPEVGEKLKRDLAKSGAPPISYALAATRPSWLAWAHKNSCKGNLDPKVVCYACRAADALCYSTYHWPKDAEASIPRRGRPPGEGTRFLTSMLGDWRIGQGRIARILGCKLGTVKQRFRRKALELRKKRRRSGRR